MLIAERELIMFGAAPELMSKTQICRSDPALCCFCYLLVIVPCFLVDFIFVGELASTVNSSVEML